MPFGLRSNGSCAGHPLGVEDAEAAGDKDVCDDLRRILFAAHHQLSLINGVLDKIVESLTAEGSIKKAGRGLIE